MAKAKTLFGPRAALGCMLLFALPFLAVGVGMTWKNYHALAAHRRMSTWIEVPAKITAVALRGKRLTASYDYELGGRRFTSDRVIYDESMQDLGGVDRLAYSELKQHAGNGQPFRAFVDPQNPHLAVLYRHLPWQELAFYTIFGAVFGVSGVGMIAAVAAGWRGAHGQHSALAHDDQAIAETPWLMRNDWAARRIEPKTAAKVLPTVYSAVLAYWLIAVAPLVSILPQHFSRGFNPWLLLTLLFPLVAIVMAVLLVRALLHAWKFGDSLFEMAGETGVLGGQLAGVVRIPVAFDAPDGFRARLSALEQVRQGDDTNTVTLWQDERRIAKPLVDPTGQATAVPILFAIPLDAPPSSDLNSVRDIQWELELTAATSGVDYRSVFDVPVFKTAESRADFELDPGLADEYSPPPDCERVIREAGLRIEPAPSGGTRLIVPMARNWRSAILVTAVVAAMATGAGAMVHFDVFLLWPILLALFALVFVYIALDLWFYCSSVDASPDQLIVRGGFFGLGRTHRIEPSEFQKFTSKEYMSSGREVWSTISVKPRSRPRVTIAKGIHGKLLERAIIEELETALGRKPN